MNNLRIVERAYAAFGDRDVESFLGMFTPDFEWRPAEGHPYAPEGKSWVGPEDFIANFLARVGPDWRNFVVTPHRMYDAGSSIVVEGRYTGTHAATRLNLDAEFCHIWTLADGKIDRFRQYVDTAQLQRVSGMTRQPPPAR